jgi:AbiV family abortive infection protein
MPDANLPETTMPDKNMLSEIEVSAKDCLSNAEQHLAAAKALRGLGVDFSHIAYHNAVICLEEVGKALIVRMTYSAGDNRTTLRNWVDDHVKKLFWALWSPTFGRSNRTVEEFFAIQEGARTIHEKRLATLYVDTSLPRMQRQSISQDELENILVFAESRLQIEQAKTFEEPNESARADLEWFLTAADDPNLKLLVWSKESFAKLKELEGHVGNWVKWLRKTAEEAEKRNGELLAKELGLNAPEASERPKPKWRVKVRLHTSSHSIRPKVVKAWNKTVEAIKLHTTDNKDELLLEFVLQKGIPVQALWNAGWYSAFTFVCAVNMATRGFFWWYLPKHVSRFYEEVRDLENKAQVSVDRSPELKIDWGHLALQETDLTATALMYGYLIQCGPERRQGLEHYFRGLSMIAKNDIFLQFEPHAFMEFYLGLKEEFRRSGDWDGVAPFLDVAADGLKPFLLESADVRGILQLGEKLLAKELPPTPITLAETASMKILCDLYFSLLARKSLAEMRQHQDG